MSRELVISLFRKILYILPPHQEPIYNHLTSNFDLFQALQCLAVMYWKGMESTFLEIINSDDLIILETDKDWIDAYLTYITPLSDLVLDNIPDDLLNAEESPYRKRFIHNDFYFTNSISDSGTSETGQIVQIYTHTYHLMNCVNILRQNYQIYLS